MRIAINGLLINKTSAGIGHYGYEIIKKLEKNKEFDFTFFLQNSIQIDSKAIYRKNYPSSMYRILDEQIGMIRQYKSFDLIHFIDYGAPIVPIRTPFIITIHDLTYYKQPNAFTLGSRMIKKAISPISIKHASRIIADSENTKRDIVEFFPKMEKKVKVIYPGTSMFGEIKDTNIIEEVKEKYRIVGKYILYMGTLEPRKNLIRLIEAYHTLVNEEKIEEKLVLAGKKGWMYNDIFAKVIELNLQERVLFTDYISEEDKPALYSGAKVFVYPSLYEGFGLPPLEAMSCGTAVVVSNRSSLPEVVGDAGIYVNPYDVDSIAQGIYSALANKGLRQDLAGRGIEQAKLFSWEKTVDQIIEVYKEILE